MKTKNHMIMLMNTEKAFDKIQYQFTMKTFIKVGVEGVYLNEIKIIYEKPTANIILKEQKLRVFPLRSRTRQGCLLSSLLFNRVLEDLATMIHWKGRSKTVIICR